MAAAALAVLVVDDDDAIRDAIHFALRHTGYPVQEATNGVQALSLLRAAEAPLVVLLDVRMPKMSGVEVLETVAQDPRLARRHAYVLVTADDRTLPLAFATLLRELGVPVVGQNAPAVHVSLANGV